MRILFAAKYVPSGPRPIGGVQSWIKTVRTVFERNGHECHEWQPGLASPQGRYELGIFANWVHTGNHAALCERVVGVCHGIIEEERPGYRKGDRWFYVSEGVRNHWQNIPEGGILRQPIDYGFWLPRKPPEHRWGAIRYSYRTTPLPYECVAKALGCGECEHLKDATHEEARVKLGRAKLVFASGRAALEAMACGAPTVIWDHRGAYQPELLGPDPFEQAPHSYSGRGGVVQPSFETVCKVAQVALEGPPGRWRRHVLDRHDANKIAKELEA